MAELNKADYEAKYGVNTGAARFQDNVSGDIGANDMRDFAVDHKDSLLFKVDNFIDEDSFASDSATKAPSQQSVKAFIAAQVGTGGTYTPTGTAVANVDSVLGIAGNYTRSGDGVSVSGGITVDQTAGGATLTKVGISLPVASNLSTGNLYGVATSLDRVTIGFIAADGTNDRAELWFNSTGTGAISFNFSFGYQID
jgi:hypothetical protein